MDKLQWIKDLVRAEQQMEESGIVDFSACDPHISLKQETIQYLKFLKHQFIEAANAFNQLKASTVGRLKIYGISKTDADFMVFRNGYKLIFSMREPGTIAISFNHLGSVYPYMQNQMDSPNKILQEDLLVSQWRAFGDLTWTFQDLEVKPTYLVKHYLARFIRESTK